MLFHRCQVPVLALLAGLLGLGLDLPSKPISNLPMGPAIPEPRLLSTAPSIPDFEPYIVDASKEHGVSRDLIRAIIQTESEFDPQAVSSQGACGLMQLMPRTARSLGVIDCFNARENIRGGTRHLKALLKRYRGSVALSVAAYNAGETAVARHRGIPPYRQTRNYVRRVEALLATEPATRTLRPISAT